MTRAHFEYHFVSRSDTGVAGSDTIDRTFTAPCQMSPTIMTKVLLPSYGIVQFWSRTDTSIVSDTVFDTGSDTGHWPKVSVSGFATPTTDGLGFQQTVL